MCNMVPGNRSADGSYHHGGSIVWHCTHFYVLSSSGYRCALARMEEKLNIFRYGIAYLIRCIFYFHVHNATYDTWQPIPGIR